MAPAATSLLFDGFPPSSLLLTDALMIPKFFKISGPRALCAVAPGMSLKFMDPVPANMWQTFPMHSYHRC